MARKPVKEGKLLYHLTSLDNIESIIEKGLLAREHLDSFEDIADLEIIEHRKEYNLTSYVPFHFFPLTPFAGIVQKNHSDKEFVYLTLKRDLAEHNEFKIIPCHPLNYQSEPLNYAEGIEKIDWELLDLRDYSDHNCKMACMAECITHKRIASDHFHCIYVKSEATKKIITEMHKKIKNARPPFHIDVAPYMFV